MILDPEADTHHSALSAFQLLPACALLIQLRLYPHSHVTILRPPSFPAPLPPLTGIYPCGYDSLLNQPENEQKPDTSGRLFFLFQIKACKERGDAPRRTDAQRRSSSRSRSSSRRSSNRSPSLNTKDNNSLASFYETDEVRRPGRYDTAPLITTTVYSAPPCG